MVQDAANANSTYTTGENAGLTGGKDGSVPDGTDGGDADSSGEAQDGEADTAVSAVQGASHASHCVCGKNSSTTVNGHEHDSAVTAWNAADSLPDSAGSYYLTQSVSGNWIVPTGEVNLCLNGQTISGSITVGSGATLTLTDCADSGGVQGGVLVNGGKFELYSGTITGGVQVGKKGADYQTGSSFTMYGGAITGNKTDSGSGGGVFLVGTTNHTDPPSFTIYGGTISNNTAGASDGGGGGVYVGEQCSFTMDGGTITGNTATKGNGGGIYIHFNAGSVSISNATITGNKASATGNTGYGHGGGIYSQRGVTVKNVTITGNNSTYEGGGIYGKGAITLTDATVTGNNQHDVYYGGTESTNPKLTVSGSVKAGYYANYAWKLPILVSGALREDSVIRVGVREGINLGAIAEPASGVTLSAENFKADAAGCVTSLGDDGKVYLVPCTHEMDDTGYTCKKCHTQFDARVGDSAYYQTLTKAFDAAGGSTVTLLRDVTLTGNCSAAYNSPATLDLNGKTVSSERYYISVGGGNNPRTLTVMNSGTNSGTQPLTVKFLVHSNGTLAVDTSYTGEISRVELQAGGALERFGGKIGDLVLSNAAAGSTSTGYNLKLWKGNTNACTIGKFTDNNKSKGLTVQDLLKTNHAKCELHGEKGGTWSSVDKSTKIAELTGYTAYKVQFPECVHQCADDSNPVCSVCHKKLYTKITAKAADGTTKTAYFTEDSALENGYVEAIQTLNGWSNEGCTEPTLTLLRDMYAFGTSMPLTGTLTLEGGTHTAKNVTVAKGADVTFASGIYKGATIDGTATVEGGVTFTDAGVTVNGTLNAKGGTFTGNVKFNGSSIANISGGNFTNDKLHGGVEFFNSSVTGTISGGTFVFADFYTTKVKLSGGTFKEIRSYSDHKLADLLAEGAAYYRTVDDQAVTNDRVNTLENVKVVSHTHNGGKDGNGTCSICGKQMTASLTVGGTTSWYTAFATAIEAANAADGAKTITLYQNVDDTVYGKRTAYELTRGPVTLATGGKRVDGVDLIAKGISLTVTGSNGSFYVTVDGKDAELTVNDKDTELAIVTAKNGGKLSLSNGTFSRVAVKDDGSSASLSGGSYGEITSDAGYVKPYALLAKGYAYKKTKDNQWLPNANSIPSEVTVEKAPFAVEKIYPNSDTNYTGNSAFATDGSITLTAVIAPETQGVTYYYWWERFDESSKDWTTKLNDVNTATHTGGQNKTLSISNLPENSSYQYHVYVSSDNGYNCYSEPFTVTRHQHSWTYTASGATITAKCSKCSASGGSVTIAAPDKSTLTYDGKGKQATLEGSFTTGVTPATSYTQTKPTQQTLENGTLPTNAGTYTASITMGSATASVTYTIGKATPKAEDFTFTAPTSLTYDGNVKSATVSPAKAGTGDVIVKYYDKDGKEATPKNAGEYTVKIDVAESTNYAAANGLTADGWKFSITKAAAPAAETGSLTITNGTQLTYTYDFSKLLPELSEGEYGTISYGNQADISLVSQSGYYYDETIVEFKNGVLILAQFYAKDGNMTGQIGTVKVNVTTTNYADFQLTLVLNAINQIKPTPDGEITAAEITYGDALSKSTILGKMKDPDTGAEVEGSFSWQQPGDTILDANTLGHNIGWKFTPKDGNTYTEVTGIVKVPVAPKSIEGATITLEKYEFQYNAVEQSPRITGVTLENWDETRITYVIKSGDKATDANDSITLTIEGTGNYTGKATVEWKITPREVTPTIEVASCTYTGDALEPTVTLKDGAVVISEGEYTVEYSNNTNAGTGRVAIKDVEGGNYIITSISRDFPIDQAAAPTNIQHGTLSVINGTHLTYTYDFQQLLPEAPNGDYGTVHYDLGNRQTAISFTAHGYYIDPEIVEFEGSKLTLVGLYAKDGTATGQIGTVEVKVTTTNYKDFKLTLVLNAVNRIKPTPDGEITAAEITYGDTLSKSEISGKMKDPDTGAEIEGSFSWQQPGDTILDANTLGHNVGWKFTPKDGNTYTEATGTATVKVDKAQQYGKISMAGYTYGQTPSTPTLTDQTGDLNAQVTYGYAVAGSGSVQTWDIQNPPALNAGTYRMYASIGDTDNYYGFEAVYCEFVVAKATPTYTAPTGLTAKYGQTLADVTLPDGWSWMDSSESVGGASTAAKTFQATFTPTDTENYNAVENIELEVMVNKADGGSLKTVELAQKYTDASVHTYTPDWSGLPSGQAWSYNSDYSVSTGSNVTLAKHDFAADGSLLTYAISGGKAGDTVTITLKASCNNSEDFTIILSITLTEKDRQEALVITGADSVFYGQTLTLTTSGGSGTGTVTYRIDTAHSTGEATIDPETGVLTPVKVGSVSVIATKAGDNDYNDVTSAPFVLMIKPATPTGEPNYTKITTSGKTLKDAALTTKGSTLNPSDGKLEWVDDKGNVLPDSTRIEANTTYRWRFTPTGANYATLTGKIELYHESSSGGGGWYDSYYTIEATAGTGGSISPSGSVSVREGRDQTFTITPDKGYAVANVKIDGESIGAVKSYTFENVSKAHAIEVIFVKGTASASTGDSSNLLLWSALLLASTLTLAGAVHYKRKRAR